MTAQQKIKYIKFLITEHERKVSHAEDVTIGMMAQTLDVVMNPSLHMYDDTEAAKRCVLDIEETLKDN